MSWKYKELQQIWSRNYWIINQTKIGYLSLNKRLLTSLTTYTCSYGEYLATKRGYVSNFETKTRQSLWKSLWTAGHEYNIIFCSELLPLGLTSWQGVPPKNFAQFDCRNLEKTHQTLEIQLDYIPLYFSKSSWNDTTTSLWCSTIVLQTWMVPRDFSLLLKSEGHKRQLISSIDEIQSVNFFVFKC